MADLKRLMEINQDTKEILAEPYQPILIGVKQEQWNALIKHTAMVGTAIVENTALISKLPTQDSINNLMQQEIRRHNTEITRSLNYQAKQFSEIVSARMTETERNIQKIVSKLASDTMAKLQIRDLSPTNFKIKWALIGTILPATLLLWQILSTLW